MKCTAFSGRGGALPCCPHTYCYLETQCVDQPPLCSSSSSQSYIQCIEDLKKMDGGGRLVNWAWIHNFTNASTGPPYTAGETFQLHREYNTTNCADAEDFYERASKRCMEQKDTVF